jgi:hypothetical protein
MVILDRRFTLFFWRDARRAAIGTSGGSVLLRGLGSLRNRTPASSSAEPVHLTGMVVAPEFPLEAHFFLVLLCYLTMNPVHHPAAVQ